MLRVWERQTVEAECRTAETCPTSSQGWVCGRLGQVTVTASWRAGVMVRLSASFISSDFAQIAH